jgi:hypothetical protein
VVIGSPIARRIRPDAAAIPSGDRLDHVRVHRRNQQGNFEEREKEKEYEEEPGPAHVRVQCRR